MKTKKEKIVLLFGGVANDGIVGQIRSAKKKYVQRILHSSPENWEKINSLFEEYDISTVIGKLTTRSFEYLASEEYHTIRNKLFKNISSVPNIIFVFEGLITGAEEIENPDFENYPYETLLPDEKILTNVNSFLASLNLNVQTYIRTSDLTLLAQSFIEQIEEGLVFRIYLPQNHYLSNEIDRIIVLFSDYLSKVLSKRIRLDQVRTNMGIIYAFHTQEESFEKNISKNFSEFTEILNMCLNNPEKAEEILNQRLASPKQVNDIISRYTKEARRVLLDIKHSSESKILSLKQRLESELIDYVHNEIEIQSIISNVLPQLINPEINYISKFLTQAPSDRNITINYNQKIIEKVEGIVIDEFSGSLKYNDNEKMFLELFQKYEEKSYDDLKSALNELKDESVPIKYKVESKQKIKNFLNKFASKMGDVAFGILQKYIENQIFTGTG
jgi:hypothetical protein